MGFKRWNEKGKFIRRVRFAVKQIESGPDTVLVFILKGGVPPEAVALQNAVGLLKSLNKGTMALVWRDTLDVSTMSRVEIEHLRDSINEVLGDSSV